MPVDPTDDWNAHWSLYGTAARSNPANLYREQLIQSLLLPDVEGQRILDIGSGQGELAISLARRLCRSEVCGLELSAKGVERSWALANELGTDAKFFEIDLMESESCIGLDAGLATTAICSEVLEHVDHPEELLRNARRYMAPGCRVVITVPGGPRTAFDRHIGHRRHFTLASLRATVEGSGLKLRSLQRSGFPFFNLYKCVVLARGRALIAEGESPPQAGPSALVRVVYKFFDRTFRWNLRSSPFGWQLVALAENP